MNTTQALLVFVWMLMLSSIKACDLNESEIAPCVKDIEQFCLVELFPYTVQSISDSRDCLRKKRESLSKECLDYLQLDKPSVIEACLPEMMASCSNVLPGCYDIYSCLSGLEIDTLSEDCQETLLRDQETVGNTENTKSYHVAVWNSWTRSFSAISKYLFSIANQLSQQGLRGSIFLQITEIDKEGKVTSVSDVDNSESPYYQDSENNDDDDDGEYFSTI